MRRNAALVFTGNVVSKVLGLAREVTTAAFFGTGSVVASFRVALTGTFVPADFLVSDALNSSFVPLFRHLSQESKDRAQLLVWIVLSLFGGAAVALGLVLGLAANQWVYVLAPGLDPATRELTSEVLRTMSIGVPLYLVSALLNFVAMANGDFVPMCYRPGIQNLGLIAGTLGAYWFRKPILFAWGFTGSYAALCSWVLFREARVGRLALPKGATRREVGEIIASFWGNLRSLLPVPFLLQGTMVVERMVASFIGLVAVSAVDYARFISETLIRFVSVPIASAGLVEWSGLQPGEAQLHLRKVVPLVLLISVPISTFIDVNSSLLIRATFARGAFDSQSVTVTAAILLGMSVGLWAQVLGYVLVRALSAQRRNRTVLGIMFGSLTANVAFDLLAYHGLGALALGLGNTVYGFGLLGGALTALGLWGEFVLGGKAILLGGVAYAAISHYVALNRMAMWGAVGVAVTVGVGFWTVWIAAVPSLRRLVCGVIRKERRRALQ